VLIVATQRGASTEIAETVGNHPCAVSFNELLERGHFPSGYDKYVDATKMEGFPKYLRMTRDALRRKAWLSDALMVRERFCAARPAVVKQLCGDLCIVALKAHLNVLAIATDKSWFELVNSSLVRAVIVERDAKQLFCSIQRVKQTGDWGHTPEAHARFAEAHDNTTTAANRTVHECNLAYLKKFKATLQTRFGATRDALKAANRPWLELPFASYVGDQERSAERMLHFVGLRSPPPAWRSACPMAWCRECRWPEHDG